MVVLKEEHSVENWVSNSVAEKAVKKVETSAVLKAVWTVEH